MAVSRLSLRLRVFLFFALLALGGMALAAGALWFGWSRGTPPGPAQPFVTAGIVFAFLNAGLVVAVWLLFDENVAKPIERLAANLRLRAHSGVDAPLETETARYLGDLAPAAQAVGATLSGTLEDSAAEVARETARLQAQSDRLTALLTEIPVATILVSPAHRIVLYDGQAAEVLGRIAPPRLKAPLSDYFDAGPLRDAQDRLARQGTEVTCTLTAGETRLEARLRPLADHSYLLLIESDAATRPAPRPLVFDFDLLDSADAAAIEDTPLRDLCFVAFDSETTGLFPARDDVVQLGAVRVLGGRIVEGEVYDTYVNPGRPIPPASTKIHHVTDRDVAGAPDFATAGRALHHFARDAVLVAHNAPFDLAFLRRAEAQMGVEWRHPVLDTVLLSAVVFGTTEAHGLDALCERLGVTIPPELRHTALGDARATAEALVRLIPLLEARGLDTFGAVIEETRKHGRLLEDLN